MAASTEEAVFHRKVQNRLADRYLDAMELGMFSHGNSVQQWKINIIYLW